MPQGIDPEWLGERLRGLRLERGLTLQQVSEQTGISVATLSRIERKTAKSLNSNTLLTLTEWMGTGMELLRKEPQPVVEKGKTIEYMPDIVELHLRADKNLDRKTAAALADLFRSVYEQLTERMKKR